MEEIIRSNETPIAPKRVVGEIGAAVKDAHDSGKPCVLDVVVEDLPHFKLMPK